MLRFAEEMILLLLDDSDGSFATVPGWLLNYGIAGSVLMDLALENRIDTDLEKLVVIDPTPTGDSLLDRALADIVAGDERDARFWVERTANHSLEVREDALARLVANGILETRDDRFLWVFKSRRYPVLDGKTEAEVKLRIMGVLFSDDIPDPRDIVIICLADSCGIFKEILSSRELARASDRIAQVRKLDLIGQAMSQAIHDIEVSVLASVQLHHY